MSKEEHRYAKLIFEGNQFARMGIGVRINDIIIAFMLLRGGQPLTTALFPKRESAELV